MAKVGSCCHRLSNVWRVKVKRKLTQSCPICIYGWEEPARLPQSNQVFKQEHWVGYIAFSDSGGTLKWELQGTILLSIKRRHALCSFNSVHSWELWICEILSNLLKLWNLHTFCFVEDQQYSRQSKSVVLKLSCASESAGGHLKARCWIPPKSCWFSGSGIGL